MIVRQFLSREDFGELNANVERYIREVVPGVPATDAFYEGVTPQPATLKQLHRMDQDAYFENQRHRVVRSPKPWQNRRRHSPWMVQQTAAVGQRHAAASGQFLFQPPSLQRGDALPGRRRGRGERVSALRSGSHLQPTCPPCARGAGLRLWRCRPPPKCRFCCNSATSPPTTATRFTSPAQIARHAAPAGVRDGVQGCQLPARR